MAGGEGEQGGGHADGADRAAEVIEEPAVAGDGAPGAAEEGEVGGDEQEAELGGAEGALGELEAAEGMGGEEAFGGEQKEGDQHGDGDGRVREAGEGEAAEESERAEEIDDVVDVEAVAGSLLPADAGEGAVEAVAQPVEGDAEVYEKECLAVCAGEGVETTGGELGGEAEGGELVRGKPAGGAGGEPVEGAAFERGSEGAVDAEGWGEDRPGGACREFGVQESLR